MANENKTFIDEQGGKILVQQIKQLIGRNLANDEIFIGSQAEYNALDTKKKQSIKIWINPDDNTTDPSISGGAAIYTTTVVGDGVNNYILVEHDLGTTTVTTTVVDSVTKEVCLFDIEIVDENSVKLIGSNVLESTDSFDVTVMG